MPTLTPEEVRKIPKSELLDKINKIKAKIKDHDVVKDMFKEHNVDINDIDLIPMAFGDLDVSARTDHGVIILNYRLLQDGINDDAHYFTHEITHWLQQTTNDGPTQGSAEGDYLENPYEIDAFQNQTEYIADEYGEDQAENYIEKVLDHHNVEDEDEREKRKKKLLRASKLFLLKDK
jgi:cell fate (sporulation/competence/biofilm development) regulator YmcA (YheA/YmcA/DUF963 family)